MLNRANNISFGEIYVGTSVPKGTRDKLFNLIEGSPNIRKTEKTLQEEHGQDVFIQRGQENRLIASIEFDNGILSYVKSPRQKISDFLEKSLNLFLGK